MKKIIYICSILFILCLGSNVGKNNYKINNIPHRDYVPNEETAIKIAEAIWLPIYGERIYDKKPFVASLLNDSIWIVTGTLAENERGGAPYIEIQKNDCKVLKVEHGR